MDESQSLYAPDTTSRLVEHLKPKFSEFTFFDAWPNVIPPQASWPLMIVQLLTTTPVLGPTNTDEVPEVIEITIMTNQSEDAGSENVRTTARRKLQNMIQGQDPVTINEYKSDTVLFALRSYLTLDEWLINCDVRVSYEVQPLPQLPTMVGATITLTTWRRVIVNRLTNNAP